MAFGAQGWTQRPQPVQAAVSMLTNCSSTSLPDGLTAISRRVTWIAGQPTSTQLRQLVRVDDVDALLLHAERLDQLGEVDARRCLAADVAAGAGIGLAAGHAHG